MAQVLTQQEKAARIVQTVTGHSKLQSEGDVKRMEEAEVIALATVNDALDAAYEEIRSLKAKAHEIVGGIADRERAAKKAADEAAKSEEPTVLEE